MIDNRCSLVLNNQEKICINGKEYLIKAEIGRGASCICYTSTSCENGLNYIIKEFYPLTCAKRTVDMKVVAKDGAADEFLQCKKRFEKLYENNLTIQKTHKNLFVEPNYELSGNGYIVMPARDLCTLSEWVADNIPQDSANNTVIDGYLNNTLNILHSIAEQLEIYQKNNIIHFDIKPDNIFVFQENNGYFARIIDFDSIMTFSEIEELLDKNQLLKLYSTANCYGEETRASFYDKLKDGFSEKWKQIDTYPLGKLCTFILTGNKIPDIDDFTEDSSFLVSNKSETVNIRKYVFDRFIDKLTAGFGNRYSDAATVKFVVENLQTFMSCYVYFDNQLKYRKDIVPDLLYNKVVYETKGALSPLENLIKSENIFENKQSLLLVAECGMGKSTALRKLYLDAILFNQSKYRFVYYPLRKCGSEKQAKNLEKDAFALSLIDKNNAVVLLDAFDESEGNDGGDCREELTARINAICETNSVILTSRIEVKDLRTLKKVTCQAKDFSNSEMLKRIQDNSPWVKSLHGDILANPLYVIMAESVSLIDDYAREEKEIGKTCWSLIKEQLLGEIYEDEYGEEQLKINYAGELIYNYYLLRILSQFKDSKDIKSAIISISLLGEPIVNENELKSSLGETFNLFRIEERRVPLLDKHEYSQCKFLFGNDKVSELFVNCIRGIRDFSKLWLYNCDYLRFRRTSEVQIMNSWLYPMWNEFPLSLTTEYNCLLEFAGCKYDYNELVFHKKRLSNSQELTHNNLQSFINIIREMQSQGKIGKSELLLKYLFGGNETISGIDFSGMDLSSIKSFRTLNKCIFNKCKLFVVSGNFIDCVFNDLQENSFINPYILPGYSYCENGNVLTVNKKELVIVNNFDNNKCFARLEQSTIASIQTIYLNSFAGLATNCLIRKIIIPNNIPHVVIKSELNVFLDTLEISGDTIIDNFEQYYSVPLGSFSAANSLINIVVKNSRIYKLYGGCVYRKPYGNLQTNQCSQSSNICELIWINNCNHIRFYKKIGADSCNRFIYFFSLKCDLWQQIDLPKTVEYLNRSRIIKLKSNEYSDFLEKLLYSYSEIRQLNNLPKDYNIVNQFVLWKNIVIYDLNIKRHFLYIPIKVLREKMFKKLMHRAYKYDIIVFDSDVNIIHEVMSANDMLSDLCGLLNINGNNNHWKQNFITLKEKEYSLQHLILHIKTVDELPAEDQVDILRQQKEWDKYLNN